MTAPDIAIDITIEKPLKVGFDLQRYVQHILNLTHIQNGIYDISLVSNKTIQKLNKTHL